VEFVACDRVRYVALDVPIDGCRDLAELEDTLESAAASSQRDSDGRSLVVRARLVGRGALHHDLTRSESVSELLLALRDSAPSSPFCWWDAIEDATTPEFDLAEIRGRGDFASDLVQLSDEVESDAALRGQIVDSMLDAAPGALSESARTILRDPDRLSELFDRARLLALDKVMESNQ
jgi:hypothetical protein